MMKKRMISDILKNLQNHQQNAKGEIKTVVLAKKLTSVFQLLFSKENYASNREKKGHPSTTSSSDHAKYLALSSFILLTPEAASVQNFTENNV